MVCLHIVLWWWALPLCFSQALSVWPQYADWELTTVYRVKKGVTDPRMGVEATLVLVMSLLPFTGFVGTLDSHEFHAFHQKRFSVSYLNSGLGSILGAQRTSLDVWKLRCSSPSFPRSYWRFTYFLSQELVFLTSPCFSNSRVISTCYPGPLAHRCPACILSVVISSLARPAAHETMNSSAWPETYGPLGVQHAKPFHQHPRTILEGGSCFEERRSQREHQAV